MINQNRQFPNRDIDSSPTILNSQRRIQKGLFGGHVILQRQNMFSHTFLFLIFLFRNKSSNQL